MHAYKNKNNFKLTSIEVAQIITKDMLTLPNRMDIFWMLISELFLLYKQQYSVMLVSFWDQLSLIRLFHGFIHDTSIRYLHTFAWLA